MAPQKRLQKPAIFVCDLQEKFRKAIWEFDKVVLTTIKILKAANILSIPVYATSQNAKNLGSIVQELSPHLDALAQNSLLKARQDKMCFSMWVPELAQHFPSSSPCAQPSASAEQPSEIALVGIESHICITQTALDALAAGHKVYVLADGVSSCNKEEVPVALERLSRAGATVTTSESWIYEVMGDAGIEEFRKMVGLMKETGENTKTALKGLLSKI